MQVDLVLGQADQETLRRMLEDFSTKSRYQQSLHGLINNWAAMIEKTERGFPDSIYEYTNDLGSRNLLAKIETSLSDEGQCELAKTLNLLDERFKAATVPVSKSLRGKSASQPAWWWFRIPKNVSAELKKDLMNEGITE